MRVFLAFFGIIVAFAFPGVGTAQSRLPTVTQYQFESCMQKARSAGLGQQHIYIAWVSGIGHTCLQSDYPAAQARQSVLAFCERTIGPLRGKFNLTAPCRIVRDRGKITDDAYGRSLKSETPLPVEVQVFDAATGKTYKAKGTYNQVITRYRGANPAETRFDIRANGVRLCSGTTTMQALTMSVRFEANCQNHAFRGSVSASKVVRSGGLLHIVPDSVRIDSGKSWVTMRF